MRLNYANVAATLALVFSMGAGAEAASHYIISSTSQIKPSVLKQLEANHVATTTKVVVGTTGSAGANGLNGAPGPAGNNANLNEIVEVKDENTGEGGAFAFAVCPAGYTLLNGGESIKGTPLTPAFWQAMRATTKEGRTGWAVIAVGTNTVETDSVTATAYCTR